MKILNSLFYSLLMFLLVTSCSKKDDPLPVYGIITWTISNNSFKADSFAVAEKKNVGFNGRPTVDVYGVNSEKNKIHFTLDSAEGIGTFVAGDSPQTTFNSIQVAYNDKDYEADNLYHSTTVTIEVTELTDKYIKGKIRGELSSDSGNKISIDGAFDVKF